MEKSKIDDLLNWSRAAIESTVGFSFMGTPASYMLFDLGGPRDGDARHREKHIIYRVYGYLGRKPKKLVHALTHDLGESIKQINASPLCIVWRRYPDLLEPDMGEDFYQFSMRLAVMDQNLDQVELDIPMKEDGDPYPYLEK